METKIQHAGNHSRIWPSYHIWTLSAILTLLVCAIINLIQANKGEYLTAFMFLLIALVLLSIFFHARIMSLKAQDRAIRAEEQLRHYLLTGQSLDQRLRISQIIALRFASDEEFAALAKIAAEEGMGNKRIKAAIKNWRADHHRV